MHRGIPTGKMTNMKVFKFLKNKNLILTLVFILVGGVGLSLGMNANKINSFIQQKVQEKKNEKEKEKFQKIADSVLPKDGFILPISWDNLGPQLVKSGVIDESAFGLAINLTDEQKEILTKGKDVNVKIDSTNSQFVVDLLWAIGLAQKSKVYDIGPLTADKSSVGDYASTGGWTLAKGDATKYLNKSDLFKLTPEQQTKVMEIAKNVYRPCCDNPTWFPDCNHGMAVLAAIEMMVAKGLPEEEIYKNILKLNSFWFPESYITIAVYFDKQGISWDKIDAKKVLGQEYSSATGASLVSKKVGPLPNSINIAGSCGA